MVPLTFFGAVFVQKVSDDYWVDFVVQCTLPEFIYILMDPNFQPADLLKLPRLAKSDVQWGIYMDLFTDVHDKVKVWYTGSATGFGNHKVLSPSGLIGRIMSYFSKVAQRFSHEHYLHGKDGKGLTPHFVKVAACESGYSALHKVYWLALEDLIMMLTSFDVDSTKVHQWRTDKIGESVKAFREKHFKHFKDVLGINSAQPLNQGCPKDRRFVPGARKCSNPDADCPFGTPGFLERLRSIFTGQIFNDKVLCECCYKYYLATSGKYRDETMITKQLKRRRQNEENSCWWCFRQYPPKGVHGRAIQVPDFDLEMICKFCYEYWWRERSILPPVVGVYIDGSHRFECQAATCSQNDRSLARKWFFEADGTLKCENCKFSAGKKADRDALRKITTDGLQLHSFAAEDLKRVSKAAIALYFSNELQFNASTVADIKRTRKDFLDKDIGVDITARDIWYNETTPDDDLEDNTNVDGSTLLPDNDEDTTLLVDSVFTDIDIGTVIDTVRRFAAQVRALVPSGLDNIVALGPASASVLEREHTTMPVDPEVEVSNIQVEIPDSQDEGDDNFGPSWPRNRRGEVPDSVDDDDDNFGPSWPSKRARTS